MRSDEGEAAQGEVGESGRNETASQASFAGRASSQRSVWANGHDEDLDFRVWGDGCSPTHAVT